MKEGRRLAEVVAAITGIMCALCIAVNCFIPLKSVHAAENAENTENAVNSDSVVLVFDNEDQYLPLFGGRFTDVQDITFDQDKKCFVLSVGESIDPFAEMLFGTYTEMGKMEPVSADKYKVIQYGVRFDTGAGREGQFYFQTTSNMDYKESQNLSYLYAGTDKLQYVNIDASANTSWTGTVADCRFDMLTTSKYDVEFEIYYVGFFVDQAAADEYGNAWLKAAGVDGPGDDPGPTEGPGMEAGPEPFDLLLFDRRAGDVNIALCESLFESDFTSQIDSAFSDSASNAYKLTIQAGADPFIEMAFGEMTGSKYIAPVPCAAYKVMQIALKTDVSATSGTGTLYFQTDVFSGYGETKNVHYKYAQEDGIQFLNVDFSDQKLWEGNVANCRFDMFENVTKDTQMDIYYVAFFTDMAAAADFSAKYLEWTEKGGEFPAAFPVKPSAAPTAEPTDAPEVTTAPAGTSSVSGPTADSGKSDGDTDNDNKNAGPGKSFPVVPVVIGAVVLAAAIAAVAVIMAKKKKN